MSKALSRLRFTIGQRPSDEKWKYIRGKINTRNIDQPKPGHLLPNKTYSELENTNEACTRKNKTNENVSWITKRGAVLMQGRSDKKTASSLSGHRSAEMAMHWHMGDKRPKRAQSIDLVKAPL